MPKVKKHSKNQIYEKLAEARSLEAIGLHQTAICKTLGISVMTLHRWRYGRPVSVHALQLENDRLRQAVVDLLIETAKLKSLHDQGPVCQHGVA